MRYSHDDRCPAPTEWELEQRAGRRVTAAIVVMVLATLISAFLSLAAAAVVTAEHRSYALRPCSTCREIVYPTEAECVAAGIAEAQRIGLTREQGSAVYTCIVRHNVIATFRPNASGRAIVTWQYADASIDGFRVVYGPRADQLIYSRDVPGSASRTLTLQQLPPGLYYFAVVAYRSGVDSLLSNIDSKSVQ